VNAYGKCSMRENFWFRLFGEEAVWGEPVCSIGKRPERRHDPMIASFSHSQLQ